MEKTLILGKIENRKRRGQQRMRWLNDIIDPMEMNLSKLQETVKPGTVQSMGPKRTKHDRVTKQ